MPRLTRPLCAVFGLLALLGMGSCAQNPYTTTPLSKNTSQELQDSFKGGNGHEEGDLLPKGPSSELLLPQPEFVPDDLAEESVKIEEFKMNGPRFTLSAKDADIKNILLALSKGVKQNIIIDPNIEKKVTIDLKDVTLSEALENVLGPLHLDYEYDGKFIRVRKQEMQTRMFRLNYIVSQRSGASNVQSLSGQGAAGIQNTVTSGIGSGTGSGSQGSGGNQDSNILNRTFTNLVTTERNDLWREIFFGLKRIVMGKIEKLETMEEEQIFSQGQQTGGSGAQSGQQGGQNALQSLLGLQQPTINTTPVDQETGSDLPKEEDPVDEEKGYFTLNRQGGLVVVHHYPDVLMEVAEFLEAIEGSVQRQVFIQAKILEVDLNDQYRLGIDWSEVNPLRIIHDGDPKIFQGLTPGTGTNFNLLNQNLGNLGSIVSGTDGMFLGLSDAQIHLVVDALGQQGNVSVLSSPKIATLNNQRAVIKVATEDIFFLPVVIPATTTQASATQFVPSQITIGIVLDVLPQINMDGTVMMSINTSVSERAGTRTSPDGSNQVPILDVRESNSVVMAKSGQTIVIGGLMRTEKQNNTNEVPFFGKIPFLGELFQHEENINQKTELVLMLTPRVMVGSAIDDRVRMEEERLSKFQNIPMLQNVLEFQMPNKQ